MYKDLQFSDIVVAEVSIHAEPAVGNYMDQESKHFPPFFLDQNQKNNIINYIDNFILIIIFSVLTKPTILIIHMVIHLHHARLSNELLYWYDCVVIYKYCIYRL